MIPLSRWLANREAHIAATHPGEEGARHADVAETCESPSPAELAFERGYGEGLAEAEARLAILHSEAHQAAVRREEDLAGSWARKCSETLTTGLAAAFTQFQTSIERQLHDVLLPFVADAARHQAIEELLRLTKNEISRTSEPPLEIRAPASVLILLRDELERQGIAAVLIEDNTVEVRTKGHSSVFESMAGRWIEALREVVVHD